MWVRVPAIGPTSRVYISVSSAILQRRLRLWSASIDRLVDEITTTEALMFVPQFDPQFNHVLVHQRQRQLLAEAEREPLADTVTGWAACEPERARHRNVPIAQP